MALFLYFYTALDASNKYCISLGKPMEELSEMTQLVLRDDWTIGLFRVCVSRKNFDAKNRCKPVNKYDD